MANSWQLSWSPDGRWLTYVRRTSTTDPPLLEARVPKNGTTITILKDPDLRSYIWLSPSKIVLDRWEAPDKPFSNLWQIDVDPKSMKSIGNPRRLTNWAGFSVGTMGASRDGKRLVLTRETDQSNIFIGELRDHGESLVHLHRISTEDRVEWVLRQFINQPVRSDWKNSARLSALQVPGSISWYEQNSKALPLLQTSFRVMGHQARPGQSTQNT